MPARPVSRLPRRRAALVVGFAVLGLGACGQPSNEHLVDAMVTSGIDRAVATCAMEAIDDVLTSQERDWLVERGYGGAPKDNLDVDDDKLDQLRTALRTCQDQAPSTTVPPVEATTTAPAGS